MKINTYESDDFPRVYKSNNGTDTFVTIIYRDHSETYKQVSTRTKADAKRDGCEYDPYKEEEMETGNGARRVHGMKTEKVIDFTR